MKKNIYSLIILVLSLTFSASRLPAAEGIKVKASYILLNDNSIINGHILNFYQGFIYIKQQQQVLKISPAHFKGIFSSKEDATKAAIIIKKFPDIPKRPPDPRMSRPAAAGHNIADIIPTQLLKDVYIAAQKIIASEKEVKKLHNRLNRKLDSPEAILDRKIFQDLLVLSAVAAKYDLIDDINHRLRTNEMEGLLSDLDISTQSLIARKTEIVFYFLLNPAREISPQEEPELLE